jgi:hypothetical protein
MREGGNAAMKAMADQAVSYPDVKTKNFRTVSEDGGEYLMDLMIYLQKSENVLLQTGSGSSDPFNT